MSVIIYMFSAAGEAQVVLTSGRAQGIDMDIRDFAIDVRSYRHFVNHCDEAAGVFGEFRHGWYKEMVKNVVYRECGCVRNVKGV